MSKRYGRNQKRRTRAEISRLKNQLAQRPFYRSITSDKSLVMHYLPSIYPDSGMTQVRIEVSMQNFFLNQILDSRSIAQIMARPEVVAQDFAIRVQDHLTEALPLAFAEAAKTTEALA